MTRPKSRPLRTPEEISAIQSAKGKKARKVSPWSKFAMCDTRCAAVSWMNYVKRGRGHDRPVAGGGGAAYSAR